MAAASSWTLSLSAPRDAAPPQATTRLRKNLTYFKVNYLIVVLLTLIITFLTNPQSLFIVGLLLGGWAYVFVIRQSPLVISGRQLRCAAKRCATRRRALSAVAAARSPIPRPRAQCPAA
jgi:hypothetical protein